MKHDDWDKRVSAYVDGDVRGARRERLEREIEGNTLLIEQVARSRALGRLVRDAWTEGPAAPSPDYLLAAIRPALVEIDRERKARPSWQRRLDLTLSRLTAALRPSPLLATAAAVAFFAVLGIMPRLDTPAGLVAGNLTATRLLPPVDPTASLPTTAPVQTPFYQTTPTDFTADGSGSIYDVSPGRPAVLFHDRDGSVMLWLIEDGNLSYRLGAGGWG